MDMQQATAWALFLALILGMLFLDLFVFHRKPHEICLREALLGSAIPVVLAFGFAACIYYAYNAHVFHLGVSATVDPLLPTNGRDASILFLTGYLVELSLSADNIFLFVLLMAFFQVPARLQHRVLFWGVLGALVMRAIMILVGAALLARFEWLIYLFGAFLVFTGLKMLRPRQTHRDPSASLPLRLAKKMIPLHSGFDGNKFFTRINGKRLATTLFLVLVCIEATDLVFALDSIPAIFGITRDPFLVFTSNMFAILGLRSLYFLLAGIMDKFRYLKVGLALVLTFVGVKMLLPLCGDLYSRFVSQAPEHWKIPQSLSLGIILGTLALSILASLMVPPRKAGSQTLKSPSPI
jgi:tellurite resistance protein TerC